MDIFVTKACIRPLTVNSGDYGKPLHSSSVYDQNPFSGADLSDLALFAEGTSQEEREQLLRNVRYAANDPPHREVANIWSYEEDILEKNTEMYEALLREKDEEIRKKSEIQKVDLLIKVGAMQCVGKSEEEIAEKLGLDVPSVISLEKEFLQAADPDWHPSV